MYNTTTTLAAALATQKLYTKVVYGSTTIGAEQVKKCVYSGSFGGADTVTIGGVNVGDITDRERRTCIGCVEQHFSRVPGTVLERITLGDPQITAAMAKNAAQLAGIDAAVQALRKRSLLREDASLTQKTNEKTIKVAALAVSAEEAEQFAAKKQISAPLQAALLRLLCVVGAGPCRELCDLTGASMQTISRLAKLGLIETHEQEQLRSPKREAVPPAGPLTLSEEQQAAFDGLNRQMQQGQQMPYGTGNGGFQGGQMGYGAANAGAQAVRPAQTANQPWICPACHVENTGKFCSECGKPRPSVEWTCPNCGTVNKGKFCSECGSPRGEA